MTPAAIVSRTALLNSTSRAKSVNGWGDDVQTLRERAIEITPSHHFRQDHRPTLRGLAQQRVIFDGPPELLATTVGRHDDGTVACREEVRRDKLDERPVQRLKVRNADQSYDARRNHFKSAALVNR